MKTRWPQPLFFTFTMPFPVFGTGFVRVSFADELTAGSGSAEVVGAGVSEAVVDGTGGEEAEGVEDGVGVTAVVVVVVS